MNSEAPAESPAPLRHHLDAETDGILVLAHPSADGGCGGMLTRILAQLKESLPVILARHADKSNPPKRFEAEDCVSKVLDVPRESAASRNRAIAGAMGQLCIKAPVILVVDPSFIPFCQRAFATCRLFFTGRPFMEETGALGDAGDEIAGSEQLRRNRITFLERFADHVLIEEESSIEWLREKYSYFGPTWRVDDLARDPARRLADAARARQSRRNPFPHRLDILCLVDPDSPEARDGTGTLADFAAGTRHRCYHALYRSPHAPQTTPEGGIDYSPFDALLIGFPPGVPIPSDFDPAVRTAIAGFPGLRAVSPDDTQDADPQFARFRKNMGIHLRIDPDTAAGDPGQVRALDAMLSQLMPGLPNWQLHMAGKYISAHAHAYEELRKRYPNPVEPPAETPFARVHSLESREKNLNKEITSMRTQIADLDQQIESLRELAQKLAKAPKKKKRTPIRRIFRRMLRR